ncbi:SPOR domain-containing protein [Luteimonas sp. RIT-PG2_3]
MDSGLKQRLVGAAVLVALAVIFLPMLVKGPAPDSGVSDLSLRVPDAPSGDYRTVDLPLVVNGDAPAANAPAQPAPLPAPAAADDGDALPTVDTAAERNAPAASDALPAPEAATRPQPMLPATVASGNYAVHFAAFATRDQADAIVRQLRTAELPAFSEPFTLNDKPAFRVRIGPYANRAQAETVRLRAAQIRNDVTPRVLALDADAASPATVAATPKPQPAKPEPAKPAPAKPEAPKPVAATPAAPKPAEAATPAAPDTGFVVQLGAFSSTGDANALRDRLRAAGITAFTDTVSTDKGRLTRVKAGPVLTRADAERLKSRVKSAVAIDGMVRSHP